MDFPKNQEDIIKPIHHRVDSSTSVTTNTFTQAASHPSIILNTNENCKVIPALQNGVCNVLTSTCSSQPNTGFTSLVQGSNGSIILISQPLTKTANIPVSIALRNGHGPTQLQNVKKDVETDNVSSEQVTFKVPATPSVQFSVSSGENNHSENLKQTFLLNTCQSQATYIQPEQQFIAPTVSSPFTAVDPSNSNIKSPEQCQLPVVNMHSPTEKKFTHNSSVTSLQGLNVFINSNSHLNSNTKDSIIGVNSSVTGKRSSDNAEASNRPQLILPSDLSSFSSLAYNASPTKECDLTSGHVEKTSMLHTLLTSGDMGPEKQMIRVSSPTSVCSPLSPEINTDSQSGISSPIAGVQLFDSNTQSTLISKSERLQLDSESTADFGDFNWDVSSDDERKKAFKSQIHSDAPSSILEPEDEEKAFEAGSAVSTSEFTFRKFGADVHVPGVFTFGTDKENPVTTCSSVTTLRTVSSIQMDTNRKEINQEVTEIMSIQTAQPSHLTRSRTQKQRVKEPSLNQRYPMKMGGYELQIVDQPEEQHRARYLTEGSRGAVKNRSGDGHITLKMYGKAESAVLQVFVGTDSGCIKPHGFYQACKVCGKNSTPCRERDIDGTTVIEMDMEFGQDMTTTVDNVGILKLRNADVEQRIGLVKAKRKSTKARLVFRAIIQKPDGNMLTLQIASDTILCTQPVGQPEICKISLHEAPVSGGGELFLIGKNFMKGTKVFFQQLTSEEGETTWEETAEIDKDYFQPTHLICTIPKYQDALIMEPVKVQIIVSSAGKLSDPQQFVYTPVLQIKREIPMETDQCQKRITPFTAAPEALELNNQIQQSQQMSPSGMFQLPPGTISTLPSSEVTNMQVDTTPMPQATPPATTPQETDSSQINSTSFVNRQVTDMDHDIGNLAANQMPNENILGNILQEAKQDHPHDNIDKMVEAILNEKWQETEQNTQKQEQDQQIQQRQQQQQQFQQQDQLQCQLQQQKEQLQQCQQLQQQQLHQQQEQLQQQQQQLQQQGQLQQQQLQQQQEQLQQQQIHEQQEQLQQQQQQLHQQDQLQQQQIHQQQEQLQQQQQLHQQEQLQCHQIQEQLLQQQIRQQQQQFQQHQQIQQQHLQQQDQFQQQHLKQLQEQFQQHNVQQQPNVQQPNLQQQQQLQDQFQQHSAQQQLQDKVNIQQQDQLQQQQQQIKQQLQHQKEELSPQSITQTHTSPSHPSVTFQVSSIAQQPASQLLQTAALQQQAHSTQQSQSANLCQSQTSINPLQPNTSHSTGSLLQNLNYQIGPSSSQNVPSTVGPNFTSGTSGMMGSTMIIKTNSDTSFRGGDATNTTKVVIPDFNSLPNGAIQQSPTGINPQSSGASAVICNSPSQVMNQLSSDKTNGSHSIVILHVNPSTQVESVLRSVLGSLDQQRGQS